MTESMGDAERALRRMLCSLRHGSRAYTDDGEASYCGDNFCRPIDYMSESPEAIWNAWVIEGARKLKFSQGET